MVVVRQKESCEQKKARSQFGVMAISMLLLATAFFSLVSVVNPQNPGPKLAALLFNIRELLQKMFPRAQA
jgi:hypothetical protein